MLISEFMKERQENLLREIIDSYVKTCQPVSSRLISQVGDFSVSPATIRNEMMELENLGLITQTHTSSGRIPTEKGYQFYVDNFLDKAELPAKNQKALAEIIRSTKNFEALVIKELVKKMAEISREAVFIAFSDHDFYYTGLSNLFVQPEFAKHQLVTQLSRVIDHLDETIGKIFDQLENEVEVSIGSKNPFGRDCSTVLTKYQVNSNEGLVGILGPIRMNYQINVGLVKYGQALINNLG